MEVIVPVFLISFFITFSTIPVIIKYSVQKQLLDKPGGRKIHKVKTPALGGIGISFGFLIALSFGLSLQEIYQYKYLVGSILLIIILGIRDDLLPMGPYYKLLGQIFVGLLVIFFGNVRLTSMHGFFGIGELPLILSYLLSLFVIIVITNAFNLIDGLDGLCGTIGSISLMMFGYWFYSIGNVTMSILVACLLGGIFAFLKFNYSPAQIFMGDTGALMIGFVISIVAILFIETNFQLPVAHPSFFQNGITTSIAFMIYPLYDTLRIFTLRILKKRSPFSPDKSHVHHLIMRMGNTHTRTTIILAIHTVLIIIVVWLMKNLSDNVALPILLLLCIALGIVLDFRLSVAFPKKTPKKKIFK
ncbi:MAG: undecaprenyl/decaprenyl-phosphate alpha-N-acetylglucosaminyl 1-phosphate transferase [Cytophagales bacterium]|nr:undecaprenyl/decaprenyl-phosphate alpha-N-acetylglucosaminyl 1-phosphate transferase [Cytophagales bacterium]MDW8383473.1 MraY family glycosyltransferase [Flammeovirgaceae bacterium]